jgi:CBS domain-containing protein
VSTSPAPAAGPSAPPANYSWSGPVRGCAWSSAAPVIDEAGRPVGVISRSDIVIHDREKLALPETGSLYSESAEARAGVPEAGRPVGQPGPTLVRDLMTPALFALPPEATAEKVAEQMVELNVHRLFVVDQVGVLVGVISALELLRHLRA